MLQYILYRYSTFKVLAHTRFHTRFVWVCFSSFYINTFMLPNTGAAEQGGHWGTVPFFIGFVPFLILNSQ